jgi:hypothetical protein
MEFLVTMTTHVPEGTPEAAIEDVRVREAVRSQVLAAEGGSSGCGAPLWSPANGARSACSKPRTVRHSKQSSSPCLCASGVPTRLSRSSLIRMTRSVTLTNRPRIPAETTQLAPHSRDPRGEVLVIG